MNAYHRGIVDSKRGRKPRRYQSDNAQTLYNMGYRRYQDAFFKIIKQSVKTS